MTRVMVELCGGPNDGLTMDVATLAGFLPKTLNIPVPVRIEVTLLEPIPDSPPPVTYLIYAPDIRRPLTGRPGEPGRKHRFTYQGSAT